jgi:hypothetical protein
MCCLRGGIDASSGEVKMHIDARIEEQVREAFRAVIAKDGDRLVAALRDLSTEDFATAVAYGLFVLGYVVNDVFRAGPSEDELRSMARKIIHGVSEWVDLGSEDEVARLLAAAANGDASFPGVPREDIVGIVFVSGGYLLGVYRRSNEHWWDYLNEIWQELLAAPDPT